MDDALVHIIDWYPTLLSAAGIKVGHHRSTKLYTKMSADDRFDDLSFTVPLDGKDLWSAIQDGSVGEDISTDSRVLLLELNGKNCEFSSCGALRVGPWKFIRGAQICLESDDIISKGGPQWQRYALSFSLCHDLRSKMFVHSTFSNKSVN